MDKCTNHPGRNAGKMVGGKWYCPKCLTGQAKAVTQVARTNEHVEPKSCFVAYKGHDVWEAIPGTGCAHWIAHQRNISNGSSWNLCLLGRTIRVADVVKGRTQIIERALVLKNDIWASDDLGHAGLVTDIKKGKEKDSPVKITITHDSSKQGGVSVNDFDEYFKGKGAFYR